MKELIKIGIIALFSIGTFLVCSSNCLASSNYTSPTSHRILIDENNGDTQIYMLGVKSIKKYGIDGNSCTEIHKNSENMWYQDYQSANGKLFFTYGFLSPLYMIDYKKSPPILLSQHNAPLQAGKFCDSAFFTFSGNIFIASLVDENYKDASEYKHIYYKSSVNNIIFQQITKVEYEQAYNDKLQSEFGNSAKVSFQINANANCFDLVINSSKQTLKIPCQPNSVTYNYPYIYVGMSSTPRKSTDIVRYNINDNSKKLIAVLPSSIFTGITVYNNRLFAIIDDILVEILADGSTIPVYNKDKDAFNKRYGESLLLQKSNVKITNRNITFKDKKLLSSALISSVFDKGDYIFIHYVNDEYSGNKLAAINVKKGVLEVVGISTFIAYEQGKLIYMDTKTGKLAIKNWLMKSTPLKLYDYAIGDFSDGEFIYVKINYVLRNGVLYFFDLTHRKMMKLDVKTEKFSIIYQLNKNYDIIYMNNISADDNNLYFHVDAWSKSTVEGDYWSEPITFNVKFELKTGKAVYDD